MVLYLSIMFGIFSIYYFYRKYIKTYCLRFVMLQGSLKTFFFYSNFCYQIFFQKFNYLFGQNSQIYNFSFQPLFLVPWFVIFFVSNDKNSLFISSTTSSSIAHSDSVKRALLLWITSKNLISNKK